MMWVCIAVGVFALIATVGDHLSVLFFSNFNAPKADYSLRFVILAVSALAFSAASSQTSHDQLTASLLVSAIGFVLLACVWAFVARRIKEHKWRDLRRNERDSNH